MAPGGGWKKRGSNSGARVSRMVRAAPSGEPTQALDAEAGAGTDEEEEVECTKAAGLLGDSRSMERPLMDTGAADEVVVVVDEANDDVVDPAGGGGEMRP